MRIAIIGASREKSKYSNKAVRAYIRKGWDVVPVNPLYDEVEGIKAVKSVSEIEGRVDAASFYVRPEIGIKVADEVIEKGIPVAYLNPGSESEELAEKLEKGNVKAYAVCSIRAVRENPELL